MSLISKYFKYLTKPYKEVLNKPEGESEEEEIVKPNKLDKKISPEKPEEKIREPKESDNEVIKPLSIKKSKGKILWKKKK